MRRYLFVFAPVLSLLFALPVLVQAQDGLANRAGVVIRFGDGRVATACVQFSEPSISGVELLQRSGIPLVTQGGGIGTAVCKIENEGCDYPAEDCFCKRDGSRSIYWAYNRLREGAWTYSPLGASSTNVQTGDVDGWAWGSGDTQGGAQPPLLTFEQVCALAAPQATALPVSTAVALVPTDAPTTIAPAVPTIPPAQSPNANTAVPWNYIAFGVIALALITGIIVAFQRHT